MKIYRLIDDGVCVLTTFDPIKIVEKFEQLSSQMKDVSTFVVWLETEELK